MSIQLKFQLFAFVDCDSNLIQYVGMKGDTSIISNIKI